MDAAELTTLPTNANAADYNRVVRFVMTTTWSDAPAVSVALRAKDEGAAKVEATKARQALSTLPNYRGSKLTRQVRYVFEPHCAEKHDNAEF